jgi:hypothetical protein
MAITPGKLGHRASRAHRRSACAALIAALPAIAVAAPMVETQPHPSAEVQPYLAAAAAPALGAAQKIALLRRQVKYVFVLYQENRSFDSYFAPRTMRQEMAAGPRNADALAGNRLVHEVPEAVIQSAVWMGGVRPQLRHFAPRGLGNKYCVPGFSYANRREVRAAYHVPLRGKSA